MGVVDVVKFPFRMAKKGIDMTVKQVQTPLTPKQESIKQSFVMDMSGLLTIYGIPVDESIKAAQDFYNLNKSKIRDVLGVLD